ncbi:MAG: sulfur oxidation c-type cytochrome SoxX [Chromatiales bacterium]|jgi:sulfur-oxidizing protein SoxX
MRKTATKAATAASLALVLGTGVLAAASAQAADDSLTERQKEGKEIAFDRKKGNCLACHMIDDGVSPGDIGPPLVAMKARFPERERLYNQIYDPMKVNPETRMPPFGEHRILSEEEINKVVDYLYTL